MDRQIVSFDLYGETTGFHAMSFLNYSFQSSIFSESYSVESL